MNTIVEYRQYIDGLPLIDEPEIFGLHENANIAFQVWHPSRGFISMRIKSMPRLALSLHWSAYCVSRYEELSPLTANHQH